MSSTETPSCWRYTSCEDLQNFCWDKLISELSVKAPTLLCILQAATKKRIPRKNTKAVICMCAAILFKHLNSSISLVQKVVTTILFAGHAMKQVSHVFYCMQ